MALPCDREGSFRGEILAYGLTESNDKAVGVNVRVHLLAWWTDGAWQDWSGYDPVEAEGCIWIVKKDGNLNERAVKGLIDFAGWDGSMESIANETWRPLQIGLTVERDEFKGQMRFKIGFINDFSRTPGAMSTCSPSRVQELSNRFGAQFRAIAGNAQRNSAPPQHSSPQPPPPARVPTASPANNSIDSYPPADIPF